MEDRERHAGGDQPVRDPPARDPDERCAWYLEKLHRRRHGLGIPADRVRATFLIAEVDGVRPGYRRRGLATEILRQSLIVARAEGVDRVLVTCDADNRASAIANERCGGVLRDTRVDAGGTRTRRYWIA